VKESKR